MMHTTESAISLQDNPMEYVDLSDYCRLCLQVPEEYELLDLQLIYDEEECLSYYDCFTICTQIDLRAGGDNAPHQLCKSCGLELQVAYDFHKKVEESKRFLMQLNKPRQADEDSMDITAITKKEENELLDELEFKTNNPQLLVPPHAEDETMENGMMSTQEDAVGNFEASIEYEELEDHIEMEQYQSVDELADEAQVEYILVEELKTVSDEVTLPYRNADNNDVSTSNSLKDSTFEPSESGNSSACCAAATSLSDHTGNESNNELVVDNAVPNNSPPPPTRACTSDLPIKIIRQKRVSRICCEYCQKSFPSHSKMTMHRRMHEPDRPRFDCPFESCNRTYLSRQSCELHYKQMHCSRADFQPFECILCHKTFAIAQTLEVHMRYHTRQFPFECPHCERRFGQKSHLTSHVQIKHNNFRYICPEAECGKMFKNTISLRNHSYAHTGMPFRCAYCDRGYAQKSRLKVHLVMKHEVVMSLVEMESMRKRKSVRTRHSCVKLDTPQWAKSQAIEGSVENVPVSNACFEDIEEEIEVNV